MLKLVITLIAGLIATIVFSRFFEFVFKKMINHKKSIYLSHILTLFILAIPMIIHKEIVWSNLQLFLIFVFLHFSYRLSLLIEPQKKKLFLSFSLVVIILQILLLLNTNDSAKEFEQYRVNFVTSCTQSSMDNSYKAYEAAAKELSKEDKRSISKFAGDYCFCIFWKLKDRGILLKETFKDSASADILIQKFVESNDGRDTVLRCQQDSLKKQ